MKKILIFPFIMFLMTATAFCGERLSDTPYYYEYISDGGYCDIYDNRGNIVSHGEYDRLKTGGGNIIARRKEFPQTTGIIDTDFNILLEFRFSQINYNENTKTYECLTWGEGKDKIEFFNIDMKPVSQPKDIRKLEGTDCFYERVIDENAEINSGYISYYICDENGNRLSDVEYMDIKAISGNIVVTDVNNRTNTYNSVSQLLNRSDASSWARESITNAIAEGIVPPELQSDYTDKITRKEFCRLAIQTYIAKTGNNVDENAPTPFGDVDDIYVTAAYKLGIVSGTGNNSFSPNNNITRQEAAVMLSELANVLSVKSKEKIPKFIDEGYFASWAKDAIYNIASVKSGDTYIMTGTEPQKFSPWMNYTREQAIATMLRLYNYREKPAVNNGQYVQPNNSEYLYFIAGEYTNYSLVAVRKDGSDSKVLDSGLYSSSVIFTDNEYIYYDVSDYYGSNSFYKIRLDGTEKTEISSSELENASEFIDKNVYDEKYKYYYKEDWSMGMRSPDYSLARSDKDGSNEKILCIYTITNPILLYDGNVYISSTSGIIKTDSEGNSNILADSGNILSVENGRVYYYLVDKNEAYSMNTDGSDKKLLYKYKGE